MTAAPQLPQNFVVPDIAAPQTPQNFPAGGAAGAGAGAGVGLPQRETRRYHRTSPTRKPGCRRRSRHSRPAPVQPQEAAGAGWPGQVPGTPARCCSRAARDFHETLAAELVARLDRVAARFTDKTRRCRCRCGCRRGGILRRWGWRGLVHRRRGWGLLVYRCRAGITGAGVWYSAQEADMQQVLRPGCPGLSPDTCCRTCRPA